MNRETMIHTNREMTITTRTESNDDNMNKETRKQLQHEQNVTKKNIRNNGENCPFVLSYLPSTRCNEQITVS